MAVYSMLVVRFYKNWTLCKIVFYGILELLILRQLPNTTCFRFLRVGVSDCSASFTNVNFASFVLGSTNFSGFQLLYRIVRPAFRPSTINSCSVNGGPTIHVFEAAPLFSRDVTLASKAEKSALVPS